MGVRVVVTADFATTCTYGLDVLAAKIASLTGNRLPHIFFNASGSEANDTVFRMVRHYWKLKGEPKRTVFISRWNAYHGSTVAGVSLGGNALLRWAEEAGETAAVTARAVAAISSPVDLAAAGRAIAQGFNRVAYTRMFLASMKPKALAKWQQHPGLFDRQRLQAARTLYEFDEVFTAPLHGFRGTDDYWARASAKPHLHRIRIPALVLNARNDPFVPADSLPRAGEVGRFVTLWQPAHGGHAGFPAGRFPGHLRALPQHVLGWMAEQAGVA